MIEKETVDSSLLCAGAFSEERYLGASVPEQGQKDTQINNPSLMR